MSILLANLPGLNPLANLPFVGIAVAYISACVRASSGAKVGKETPVGAANVGIGLYMESVWLRPTDYSYDVLARLSDLFQDCIEAENDEEAAGMMMAFRMTNCRGLKMPMSVIQIDLRLSPEPRVEAARMIVSRYT